MVTGPDPGGGAGGGTSSGSTTVHDVVRDAQRANATRSSGQTGGVNSEGEISHNLAKMHTASCAQTISDVCKKSGGNV